MKKFAVIDLGTNTFHLLIVNMLENGIFQELYRERRFVKLGENGVKTIGKSPFERGYNALNDFKNILVSYEIKKVRIFGTAALRTASNGPLFVEKVKSEIGLNIQLISGDEEARLIHLGVSKAVVFGEEKSMIMDIGGGSVEFIIADKHKVFWAQSFPIGVSILKNNFHQNEPISHSEIKKLHNHFDAILIPLKKQLENIEVQNLIGASGTFDVLEIMLNRKVITKFSSEVSVADFFPMYNRFIKLNLQERLNMSNLPSDRADMIVVALILIKYIVDLASIQKITVSAFAMKEGMLTEMSEK